MFRRVLLVGLLFLFQLSAHEIFPDLTINIPMRDGTELPTDLYFPKGDYPDKKPPCILVRSPAGRTAQAALSYVSLAPLGYLIAIQETRSSLDKEGKTLPYWTDGWGAQKDGYDTIEWLATSSYTNGKIGTAGISALGITQLLLAPTAPPSLKCQYISMAAACLFNHAIFPGGQLLKNQVEGWLNLYAKSPEVHKYVCSQAKYNPFWEQFNTSSVANKVHAPAVHYGGWYDIFTQGTIDAFVFRQEKGGSGARGQQKLVIGPWTHHWPKNHKLGDFDVPVEGRGPPIDLSQRRWFEYYLKGVPNGIDKEPSIIYYVMGAFDGSPSSGNVWRRAKSWPIPAQETALYLTSDRKLAMSSSASKGKAVFAYQDNPENPVPTIGGSNLFLESGPKDQRSIEERGDVLVFSSDPLIEDIEVTGRIKAKLAFSSDQKDTALMVKLCDVYPDGRSFVIADGATCIHSAEVGKLEAVDVDLWSTSIVFAKGHRIRIAVSSSNYPKFEKNNYPKEHPIAHNALHAGGDQGSLIMLPVVRKGNNWLIVEQESITK